MLIISVILIAVLIAADQLLKHWAVTELLPVITKDLVSFGDVKVIALTYVQNDGAAFSSFSGAKFFLIGLTSVLIIALTVWLIKNRSGAPFMIISTAVVIAGGIGNLIDRVRLGYVIDYIEVKLFRFAIFNFADICVVIGAFCLVIYMIFFDKKATGKNGQA